NGSSGGGNYNLVATRGALFDLEPNTFASPQDLGSSNAVLGSIAAAKMYAVSGAANTSSTLYEINSATGAVVQTIRATGFSHITGIDVHPITGEIYAVSNNTHQLLKLDPLTGAVTVVGSTGIFYDIPDISFRSDGTLFAWVEGLDDLATINLSTGLVTTI